MSVTDRLPSTPWSCTRYGNSDEPGFGDWLAERLRAEQRAMLVDMHAMWEQRHIALRADIVDAFRRSSHEARRSQMEPPCPQPPDAIDSPSAPTDPQLIWPVVSGSPVEVLVDAPQNAKPQQSPSQHFQMPLDYAKQLSPSQHLKMPKTLSKEASASSTPTARRNEFNWGSECSKYTSYASYTSTAGEPREKGCISKHWHCLEIIFGAGILANLIAMLVEEQYRGLNIGVELGMEGFIKSGDEFFPGGQDTFEVLNLLFTIMFTLELACHLYREGRWFYRCAWIWLDLIIVPFAWLEIFQVLHFLAISPARFRILRVLRLFQLIESMECFDKLHLMMRSLKASFSCLLWSMVMILFTQVVAALWLQYMLSDFYNDSSKPERVRQQVFERFGTTSRTLLTMFQVVFANWADPCWLLVLNVHEWYGLFFVLYRCLLCFALITVATSMFIAETHRICDQDKEMATLQKKRDEEGHKDQIREIFAEVDQSGDGNLSWQELQVMLENRKMRRWAEKIGIDPLHLTELFKMLRKGEGTLQESYVVLDEFVSGLLKVGGTARSIDILGISHAVQKMHSSSKPESCQSFPFESVLCKGSSPGESHVKPSEALHPCTKILI